MDARPREDQRLFPIEASGGGRVKRAAVALTGIPLSHLLSLERIEGLYQGLAYVDDCETFLRVALDVLQIRIRTSPAERDRIPREGPLIVVSNHPYGGLDGLILARLLMQRRADVKILANYLLERVPQVREIVIPVDPWSRTSSRRSNALALRASIRWVQQGGALAMFPAGEVSSLDLRRRCVADPSWQPTVGRLVRRTGATVVPVYFCGRNGALFQLAGLLHPTLRTALLPHELLNKTRTDIEVRIGTPLRPEDLPEEGSDERITSYLRARTEILGRRTPPRLRRRVVPLPRRSPVDEPVAAPRDPHAVAAELEALPPRQRLLERGELVVVQAHAHQIPEGLLELGRLREQTFRAVGEGTGRERDLDRFDTHYSHLLLYQRRRREIVGAYRFARTDRVLPVAGVDGLYTSTLFHLDPALFQRLGPTLELGRSFVRPSYQRGFAPLLLLWQGIGRFLARHPWYRHMLGPVSISKDYLAVSRWLMVRYLERHHFAADHAALVRARRPFLLAHKELEPYAEWLRQIEDLSGWVAHVETEQTGVPVLLRQYLRLGGRLLAFNVDPAFHDCVDGLIWVDLLGTDRRFLRRVMGPAGASTFRSYHAPARSRVAG